MVASVTVSPIRTTSVPRISESRMVSTWCVHTEVGRKLIWIKNSRPGMVRSAFRVVLCVLIGLLAGRVLAPLFVPDPTGILAAVLAIGIMVITSTFLYRSDWLREQEPVA